jgi:hypothetical protein
MKSVPIFARSAHGDASKSHSVPSLLMWAGLWSYRVESGCEDFSARHAYYQDHDAPDLTGPAPAL